MFKKSERLSRAAFEEYFTSGRKQHSEQITLVHSPHKNLHVSVVVGKKVAKKAHDRNSIRRGVYGIAYRLLKKTNKTGVFIFLTKPKFSTLSRKQRHETVQNIIKRITLAE